MYSKYDKIQENLDTYKQQLVEPDSIWPEHMIRVVEFIYQYLFDPRLTVRWVKEQCRISRKSFSSIFRSHTGYYPKEYILYHRIEASKLLLQNTEATVTQIALAVGFSWLSAFCNTFKNKQGVKPSKWRKQNQN